MRFFSERGIEVQNVDLDQKAPGAREIDLFIQVAGEDAILDTESREFQKRGLAYMDFDVAEEVAEHPGILRTPIVRSGRRMAVGDDPESWAEIADGARAQG